MLRHPPVFTAHPIKEIAEFVQGVVVELEMIRAVDAEKPFVNGFDLGPAAPDLPERILHGGRLRVVPVLFHQRHVPGIEGPVEFRQRLQRFAQVSQFLVPGNRFLYRHCGRHGLLLVVSGYTIRKDAGRMQARVRWHVRENDILINHEMVRRMKIVLASESQSRRRAMDMVGVPYETRPANIDEKAIRDNDPAQLTRKLAEAKAWKGCRRLSGRGDCVGRRGGSKGWQDLRKTTGSG